MSHNFEDDHNSSFFFGSTLDPSRFRYKRLRISSLSRAPMPLSYMATMKCCTSPWTATLDSGFVTEGIPKVIALDAEFAFVISEMKLKIEFFIDSRILASFSGNQS